MIVSNERSSRFPGSRKSRELPQRTTLSRASSVSKDCNRRETGLCAPANKLRSYGLLGLNGRRSSMASRTFCGAIEAIQGTAFAQIEVCGPHEQFSAVNARWFFPAGAQRAGEEGPNREMVGTRSPAAKCRMLVSPVITNWARFITAKNVARSGKEGSIRAAGMRFCKSWIRDCSLGVMPVENTRWRPAAIACRYSSAQLETGHSFFSWLEEM